ncbi:DNA-directed RNA polymerase subunit alpha C-terminal domain-containing protein [Evansella clarkii]|uniref:DNA-directed RNA polymerase subunit alpha C-terminal domain-containing protein n=1 Tax=Evansella clarkii TaxID=79879 RepID=UPI000998ABBF|nr:DNA-directed RNA polymerase subunit alpha C-terminal domain-containing protein [Evansella clarkii]
MTDNTYPFNLIRAIYGDKESDTTHTETTYIKGLFEQIDKLNEKEQRVLSLRYKEGLTYKECEKYFGVSAQRITQIKNQALRKLRHRTRAKHYETVTKAELDAVKRKHQKAEKENEKLKEVLEALGSCDIDPHAVILLANMVRPEHLDKHVGDLNLSTRTYNCLARAGILTIGDLIRTPEEQLVRMRSIGEKSLKEIKSKIRAYILLPNEGQEERGMPHASDAV